MIVAKTDTAILGAGASGLFLASFLNEKDYILIDHNPSPLKIKVSGGGKCNFTNEFVGCENYVGDKEIIKNVLDNFSNKDVLKFFNDVNIMPLKSKTLIQ